MYYVKCKLARALDFRRDRYPATNARYLYSTSICGQGIEIGSKSRVKGKTQRTQLMAGLYFVTSRFMDPDFASCQNTLDGVNCKSSQTSSTG